MTNEMNATACNAQHAPEVKCAPICRRYVGERVTYSGFPGVVVSIYSVDVDCGTVHGMVEVRLRSGVTVIDAIDAVPAP